MTHAYELYKDQLMICLVISFGFFLNTNRTAAYEPVEHCVVSTQFKSPEQLLMPLS